MKPLRRKPVILQDSENEVPVEVLARAIVEVASAAKKLLSSRLTERALVILIQDSLPGAPRIGIEAIRTVLRTAAELDVSCLKRAPAAKLEVKS